MIHREISRIGNPRFSWWRETAPRSLKPLAAIIGALVVGLSPVQPIAAEAGTRSIAFITDRMKRSTNSVSKIFSGERGVLRQGMCTVSRTPIPGLRPLAESVSFHIPQNIDLVESIEEIATAPFWEGFAASADGRRPTLYIHGYRMNFPRACRHAVLLQDRLGLHGRLALFSWPSDGTALGYSRDEANIVWSIPDLRRTIRRMIDTFGPGGFNIIAHSLGSRAAIEALLELGSEAENASPMVNRLVLVAPDVDIGTFAPQQARLRALSGGITVFVSSRDAPLALSRQVHGYPRLGQSGRHLDILKGIETIDVSDLDLSTPTGHLYHLFNETVADSMRKRLLE